MNTKNTKNTTKIVIGMLVILCMFIVGGCNKDDGSTTELSVDTSTIVATSTDIATDTDTTNVTTEITTEKEKVESTTEAKVDTESTTTEDKTEVSTVTTTTTEVVTTTEQTTQQTPSTTQAPATTSAPTTTQAPTTEAPKCNHNWVAQTKVVHHDAVGHMETKGTYIDASGNDYGANPQIVGHNGKECVIVGSDWYDQCGVCGIKFYASAYGGSDQAAAQAMADHRWSVHDGCANDIISSDPIYVEVFYKEIAIFVEDKAAYDETITTGYKCSICGATK